MLNLFSSNKGFKKISPKDASAHLKSNNNALLIDVRSREEHEEIMIPGSILVPLDILKHEILKVVPEKDRELIIYCRSGARASTACGVLAGMGYTNVNNMGGIINWPYETKKSK